MRRIELEVARGATSEGDARHATHSADGLERDA
jgi:hypothetical protein